MVAAQYKKIFRVVGRPSIVSSPLFGYAREERYNIDFLNFREERVFVFYSVLL